MPFSEKKGRFTICISEAAEQQQAPQQPSSSPQDGWSAAGQPNPGSAPQSRAVKRGRFLVSSCLPCARPCLAPTLSMEEEHTSLVAAQGDSAGSAAAPRAAAPASPDAARRPDQASSRHGQWQQPLAGGRRVDGAQPPHAAAAAAAAAAPGAPDCVRAPSAPPQRAVRFSEPAGASQPEACAPPSPPLPARLLQPHGAEAAAQAQHTRSYSRGRFAVQEGVIILGTSSGSSSSVRALARSTSAPDVAPGSWHGGAAKPAALAGSGGQPGRTPSLGLPLSADVLAANQLMSGLADAQLQLHQARHHHHGGQHGSGAPRNDALLLLRGACGSSCSSSQASSLIPASGAGPLARIGGGSVPSLASSDSGSSASSSCCGCYGDLLLPPGVDDGCCSGGCTGQGGNVGGLARHRSFGSAADAAAAAAAAAAGHHQHLAPKRSASVSFFRRGRFLVQTTVNVAV